MDQRSTGAGGRLGSRLAKQKSDHARSRVVISSNQARRYLRSARRFVPRSKLRNGSPVGAALYFLMRGRSVLYVGRTRDIQARIYEHTICGKRMGFSRVLVLPASFWHREPEFIRALQPPYNTGWKFRECKRVDVGGWRKAINKTKCRIPHGMLAPHRLCISVNPQRSSMLRKVRDRLPAGSTWQDAIWTAFEAGYAKTCVRYVTRKTLVSGAAGPPLARRTLNNLVRAI